MEGRACAKKLNLAQLLHAEFHTLLLFYLRAYILRVYARENYETVDIHCNTGPIFKVGAARWLGRPD